MKAPKRGSGRNPPRVRDGYESQGRGDSSALISNDFSEYRSTDAEKNVFKIVLDIISARHILSAVIATMFKELIAIRHDALD
ncbi:MAG: hypothetical protein LBL72_06305 [Candidatus Accumulibacter sp.]|nr:hypothetical protein [Accumulibacter sp.]